MRQFVVKSQGNPPQLLTVKREDARHFSLLDAEGQGAAIDAEATVPSEIVVTLEGVRRRVHYHVDGDTVRLTWGGASYTFDVADAERLSALGQGLLSDTGVQSISSAMPGQVVKVHVEVGQSVEAGDPIVVVEAMKMENILSAEAPGVVTEIHCEPGKNVEGGAELVRIEPTEEV